MTLNEFLSLEKKHKRYMESFRDMIDESAVDAADVNSHIKTHAFNMMNEWNAAYHSFWNALNEFHETMDCCFSEEEMYACIEDAVNRWNMLDSLFYERFYTEMIKKLPEVRNPRFPNS